ncbi:MAG: hypothetical protein KDA52_17785, partial [Planctomycetaceae bacterium]|nr:hypothetical protein [Planctomycetaceae bacterium]
SQASRRPATANELATLASTGRTPSELRRRIAHLLGEPMHEPLGLTRGTIIAAAVVLLGMSTFLLTSAETADDESQETAQAEPTFSFGGKVEEVTIGTQDEEPQQWWDAEGQVLASPSFTWEKSGNVSADSMIQRRVAFRVDDLPEDAQVLWTIDVASAFATGRATTSEPRPNSQYFARSFGLSNDARTFNIRIGVATGPWKTAAQMDAASNSSLGSHDLSLTCSGAVLTEQGTMAVISHNDSDHNIRIVAVDKQGNLHDSRTRGQVGAGKITQMTLLFPDQLPDDIDHFEFQTRDYEWVEINDLPLHPKDDDNATNIPARTLQFPEDRAIGAVLSRPAADSGFGFEDDPWDGWQELSLAQGVVSIPAGQHVQLNVSRAASADLTPLADLPPDAIESLSLKETDVTDDGLKHIAHLTGLRFLNLDNTRITDKALAHLKNLHQLQTLYLSAYDVFLEGYGVGDEGMKTIAQLPALENVGLRRTKITDGGLDALAECETLQGLDLDETAVTDAGLVPLLKLPQLRGLTLRFYYGFNDPGITDAALLTLRQMQTLRYLDLHGVPITNDGLQQLAGLTKLKRLSINNTQVTGEGLVHLANMQKLEHLYFYDRIDDETVKNVSRLKGLKNLSCNLEVSDKGVAELSTLPLLEQLSLSSPTVTDASMKLIAGMPGLRTLWFQHCPITDRGLSILRNNSNIEHLMIRGTEATTASLRSLMTLPNLKSLDLSLESTEETPQWEDLRWFSHLERLELSGSTFRSADLTHLQGLTQLGLLSLELDQPIDDAGITSLAPLINLTGLGIYKSHVSDEGLKSLSNMTKLERLNV